MWAGDEWIFMGWYLHAEPMSHQQMKNIYNPTQLDTFIQDFLSDDSLYKRNILYETDPIQWMFDQQI